MNTALKQPDIIGIDHGTGRDLAAFSFICCDCGCTELRPTADLPEDWDLIAMDITSFPLARCPDCNEQIETDKIRELRETGAATPPTVPPERSFSVFLEKQDCGQYRIAMAPEAVLMRWLPLGFFLTAAQAHALADELRTFAMLAEHPGELPTSKGERK